MSTHAHNPFAEQRPLSNYEIFELERLAAKRATTCGGPLPWIIFNPGRHYVDIDMEAVLEGDPIVMVRCKECDHFALDYCTCNQESLSDAELDELLASATTPNLAALYALAKEK